MQTTDSLLVEHHGAVATVVMNRPAARNALTFEMLDSMLTSLHSLASEAAVKVVMLKGAGDSFCAGGDLKGIASRADAAPLSTTDRVRQLRKRMEISGLLHEMPKATVACIAGTAAGAGFSLALACDVRIMADNARLIPAFARIGLSGDFGGSFFLSHLVGAGRAREIYFSGKTLDAAEAQRLGIANRCVPATALEDAAWKYAQELAAVPGCAIAAMKQNINLALHAPLHAVLDSEAENMVSTSLDPEHAAAVRGLLNSTSGKK